MEKGMLRKVLAIVLICMFAVMSLSACGGTGQKPQDSQSTGGTSEQEDAQTQSAAKVVEIRYTHTYTAGDLRHEPLKELIKEFEKENPNIRVKDEALPSAELRTKLTVEAAAGNMANLSWSPVSYAREFMRDSLVLDWRVIYDDPKHPEFRQWISPVAINELDYGDGRICMSPNGVNMDGLFYNKEIFNKYGWELPKTFDDMIDLAKKAREQGITLLTQGGKDMRFAWLISAMMLRTTTIDKMQELCLGDNLTAWDDPEYGFPQAIEKFAELVKAGAYPDGVLALSRDEADQAFARGEAAMYYEGQWIPGNLIKIAGEEWVDKNIGRINFPPMTDMPNANPNTNVGGCITGLIANANQSAEELEAVALFTKAHLSPDWNRQILEMGAALYPGELEYDKTKCVTPYNEMVEAYNASDGFIASMDGLAAPAIDLAIKRDAMPGIITGDLTVEDAIALVKKVAEEYAASLNN
jgi:raffinose/stachyose/melibiose transport system substrate-binding protein